MRLGPSDFDQKDEGEQDGIRLLGLRLFDQRILRLTQACQGPSANTIGERERNSYEGFFQFTMSEATPPFYRVILSAQFDAQVKNPNIGT